MSRTPEQTREAEIQFLRELETYPLKPAALAVAKRYTSLHVNFERIAAEADELRTVTVDQALERARGAVEALTVLRAHLD